MWEGTKQNKSLIPTWPTIQANVPQDWPIHVHCFNETWKVCQRWLSTYSGCKIGLTMMVTFQDAGNLHEVAKKIPLDRLLLETDSPYFMPDKVCGSTTEEGKHVCTRRDFQS